MTRACSRVKRPTRFAGTTTLGRHKPIATGPEIPLVDQMLCQGQHAISSQSASPQVDQQVKAPAGQLFGQAYRPVELLLGSLGLPVLVVEILPTTRRVGADCLNMPIGVWGNPDVFPCRRNYKRLDPPQHLSVINAISVFV